MEKVIRTNLNHIEGELVIYLIMVTGTHNNKFDVPAIGKEC